MTLSNGEACEAFSHMQCCNADDLQFWADAAHLNTKGEAVAVIFYALDGSRQHSTQVQRIHSAPIQPPHVQRKPNLLLVVALLECIASPLAPCVPRC